MLSWPRHEIIKPGIGIELGWKLDGCKLHQIDDLGSRLWAKLSKRFLIRTVFDGWRVLRLECKCKDFVKK
jgi:hypothetical protein